jgi:predicted O-linked N-acetylglucosamine transferase (SPINDLY family)
MHDLTPAQKILIARQHFDAGRLRAAEDLCRQVLAGDPKMAEALYLAALTTARRGNLQLSASFLNRAVDVQPRNVRWLVELGKVQRRAGLLEDAIRSFVRARELNPDEPGIFPGLAEVLQKCGRYEEAIDTWKQTIERQPDVLEFHINLGDVLLEARRFAEAADVYRGALRINPQVADWWFRLGITCQRGGNLPASIDAFQRAIEIDSRSVGAHTRLGNALTDLGDIESAAAAYCRALTLKPGADPFSTIGKVKDVERFEAAMIRCWQLMAERAGDADSYFKLGVAVQLRGHIDAAINAYRKSLSLEPGHLESRHNLGSALRDAGDFDGALACYRKVAQADPQFMKCHSNLVYMMHFDPHHDPAALLREHRAWSRRFAEPLKIHHRPHENSPAPERRLRIGYVSPNFREHPVGRFLLRLFDAQDHEQTEVFSYSAVRRPDAITRRLRTKSDQWIPTLGMKDDALADRVCADKIDILVDLTMHMRDHRLLTFARRPAPVQISYLAYCSTTGLDAIDYRLTDALLDPPGITDAFYSEKSVRLPRTYWCYDPGIKTPDVNELPALSGRGVTFASLNNFCKVSPQTLDLWIKLIRSVKDSRLLLHTHRGEHRQKVIERFAAEGIDSARLEFADSQTLIKYFAQYLSIDIALDPFPYPGGTTTCDAMWMGVPTVSLVGTAGFTRSGLTILSNVGLGYLATESEARYLQTAIELASDLPRLAELRSTMRDRLNSSPLMDGPRFARDIETCYRMLWKSWCAEM